MRDGRVRVVNAWRVVTWFGSAAVLVAAAMTYWSAERALVNTGDDDLAVAADRVAAAADVYLGRTVNDLAMITIAPAVRAEAIDESGPHRPRNPAAEEALDKDWKEADKDSGHEREITRILNTPLSLYLQSLVRLEGMVAREIAITDRHGRLFAASVRTDDYLQDDDPWWPANSEWVRDCRRAPIDCALFPQKVRWDETAAAWGMDVVLPIVDDRGALAGVLKAVIDPIELLDVARLGDRSADITILNKEDTTRLLARGETEFLTKDPREIEMVKDLKRGSQTFLRESGVTAVRALWGPLGSHWVVAARRTQTLEASSWIVPAVWLGLTLMALALTTVAGRARPRTADAVSQRAVETV